MAYGMTKAAINLRYDEKNDALIETNEDGKERNYYPWRFSIKWDCDMLQVRKEFAYRSEGDQGPPRLITYITGVAASDHCISIIGEPENTTWSVKFSIRPNDSLDILEKDQNYKKLMAWSPLYGQAHMGFLRADWECDLDDTWWLECYLHSAALQPVIDAVLAGTLEEMRLSVLLNSVFTDESPLVPLLGGERLFLRPAKEDNTLDHPEIAFGWLVNLDLGLRTLDIAPAPEPLDPPESVHEEEVRDEPSSPVSFSATPAAQIVATHIDALRGTIKWVGSLIVIMLLLLLFRISVH